MELSEPFFFHRDARGVKKGVDMHLKRFNMSLVQYCSSCRTKGGLTTDSG